MCMSSPKSPPPPPPPPKPPPEPTPPSASSANLPKAEAFTDAKSKQKKGRSIRSSLQIPLTGQSASGSTGVNTQA